MIDASIKKLKIICVSLTLPTSRCVYFSMSVLSISRLRSSAKSSHSKLLLFSKVFKEALFRFGTYSEIDLVMLSLALSSANKNEFLSLACILSITACYPAGILTAEGTIWNSTGLYSSEFFDCWLELTRVRAGWLTAWEALWKLNSTSNSCSLMFLKGMRNFCNPCMFLIAMGTILAS